MGAIVVRTALAMARPRKRGRVVLLAPPNRGARLADLALRLVGRRLVAATELCAHPDSYVNQLAPATDLDWGVIRGVVGPRRIARVDVSAGPARSFGPSQPAHVPAASGSVTSN
jgi:hypothetical protein